MCQKPTKHTSVGLLLDSLFCFIALLRLVSIAWLIPLLVTAVFFAQSFEIRFNPWVGKIPWSRKWHPTAVFLPGKFDGQRNLVGCSPWGPESDMTEYIYTYKSHYKIVLAILGPLHFHTNFINLPLSIKKHARGYSFQCLEVFTHFPSETHHDSLCSRPAPREPHLTTGPFLSDRQPHSSRLSTP